MLFGLTMMSILKIDTVQKTVLMHTQCRHRRTQMFEDKEQIDRMKIALAEAMKRVPASVIDGSYQQAVKYKADFLKAQKILSKKTPKINELGWAISAMNHD